MSGPVRLQRVYQPADPADGRRVLVERLWPRGVSREQAALDDWIRDVAPSDELRRWYGHAAQRWPQFRERYLAELENNPAVDTLLALAQAGPLTLVYAARDTPGNSAQVLAALLDDRLGGGNSTADPGG